MSHEPQAQQTQEPAAQPTTGDATGAPQGQPPAQPDPGNQPQSGQPEPTPQTPEPTFSQEELNRIVARETAKVERRFQQQIQELQSQPPAQPSQPKQQSNGEPAQPQQQPAVQQPDVTAQLAEIKEQFQQEKQRRVFMEATQSKQLTAGQRDYLFKLYQVEQPDDPDKWADDVSKTLGIQTQPVTPSQPAQQPQSNPGQPQQPNAQPPAPPPRQGGAPSPNQEPSMERFEIHPSKLTKADMERMGSAKVLEYWREYGRRKGL